MIARKGFVPYDKTGDYAATQIFIIHGNYLTFQNVLQRPNRSHCAIQINIYTVRTLNALAQPSKRCGKQTVK